jgi:uncharacterized protein with HEPN domain
MSKRNPVIVIKDILRCIEHIQQYTSDLSFENFSTDFMVTEACLYNVQVIGEAVHLSDEIKTREPQIPWNLIKGMRNRLIHEYFGTDLPVVWNVIKNELPAFKIELERISEKISQQ